MNPACGLTFQCLSNPALTALQNTSCLATHCTRLSSYLYKKGLGCPFGRFTNSSAASHSRNVNTSASGNRQGRTAEEWHITVFIYLFTGEGALMAACLWVFELAYEEKAFHLTILCKTFFFMKNHMCEMFVLAGTYPFCFSNEPLKVTSLFSNKTFALP